MHACLCVCVCVRLHMYVHMHLRMYMHVCVWRTLGKVIWKHYHLQHTSLTLYLLPAGHTLLRRAGAGDDHLTHLADIWTWNNTKTSSSASCPWQLWHNHHNLSTGQSIVFIFHTCGTRIINKDDQQFAAHFTYLCPSFPVEHRPSTTPRHRTLFWAALVIPD